MSGYVYRYDLVENQCEMIRSEIENTLYQDPYLVITNPDEDTIEDIVSYTLDLLAEIDPNEDAEYSEEEFLNCVHESVNRFCGQ